MIAVDDLTRVIRQAERAGLKFEQGRKHPKIRDPRTGRSIPVSNSPSCPHAHRAVLRDIRRYLGVTL